MTTAEFLVKFTTEHKTYIKEVADNRREEMILDDLLALAFIQGKIEKTFNR